MRRSFVILGVGLFCGLVAGAVVAAPQDAIDLSAGAARVHRPPVGERALTGPSTASPAMVARDFLAARGPGAAVARDMALVREHRGPGDVTHLRFQQRFAGLPVYGAYGKASVDGLGRLIQAIDRLVQPRGILKRAAITADEALQIAIELNFPGRRGDLFFYTTPSATRVAIAAKNGAMAEGFLVEAWSARDNLLYHTVVDSEGNVTYRQLRTNTDSYNIFPEHPGVGGQQVVSNPADATASPSGWVFNDTTTGNNVDAYLDRDNNNSADPDGRPISSTQDFLFTANLSQDPTTAVNQDVAVTNLFYLNNLIHDTLYGHGFTESAGNFQENNFGRGGSGSDSVNAEAQDGGSTNNANFATPSDGSNPRMQMYLWTFTDPDRDGDLDSDIVWHEYGHGLTWRMIGNMDGPLAGAIGEGMSDVLSIYQNDNDVVGEYSFNDPGGIRRFPYDRYPLTYGDVTGDSVHNDGEIYAGAMWRLKELWEGSGRGVDELMDYVVDGMNFTPSRPAYEDMRDGILAATPTQDEDCLVWDAFAQSGIGEGAEGVESCIFIFCSVDITESFTVPSECDGGPGNTAPSVTISAPANGATFTEGDSVSFSGTADDTEDGDISGDLVWTSDLDGSIGSGASFSTSTLSVGTHSITAEVTDSGGLSGSDSISITVEEETPTNTAPTVTISAPANGATFTEGDSVSFSGSADDAEDGDISADLVWTSSLDGQIGTGASFSRSDLSVGSHTIDAGATDSGGLSGTDSVSITVEEAGGGAISLSATGFKVKGQHTIDLSWSGATSSDVDIYRDGAVITTTANDGFHTDSTGNRGKATYTYQVCEAGTSTCSNEATVTF